MRSDCTSESDSLDQGTSNDLHDGDNLEPATPPRKNVKRSRDDTDDGEVEHQSEKESSHQNPSPSEETASPPLPLEAPPQQDDGWDPVWDDTAQAFYFYNRFTAASQWTNPRVPEAQLSAPGVGNHDRMPEITALAGNVTETPSPRPHGGYDPAIHGDYDPTAPYAQDPQLNQLTEPSNGVIADASAIYTATGVFNRFTGKWQAASITPENHNDENKSKRQMSAFFDVDAAANSHNGKSLKAERSGKKLTKQELKAFKEKRKEKKEEKRRAWLRD